MYHILFSKLWSFYLCLQNFTFTALCHHTKRVLYSPYCAVLIQICSETIMPSWNCQISDPIRIGKSIISMSEQSFPWSSTMHKLLILRDVLLSHRWCCVNPASTWHYINTSWPNDNVRARKLSLIIKLVCIPNILRLSAKHHLRIKVPYRTNQWLPKRTL